VDLEAVGVVVVDIAEMMEVAIAAMTDRMSSEMGMTETVHPGDNDHDDSDLVYQERIVHLRMEKAAKVAINIMMVVT